MLPQWMMMMHPDKMKMANNHDSYEYRHRKVLLSFPWELTDQGYQYWDNIYKNGFDKEAKEIFNHMAALAEPIKTNTWDIVVRHDRHQLTKILIDTPFVVDNDVVKTNNDAISMAYVVKNTIVLPGSRIAAALTVLTEMDGGRWTKLLPHMLDQLPNKATIIATTKAIYVNGRIVEKT